MKNTHLVLDIFFIIMVLCHQGICWYSRHNSIVGRGVQTLFSIFNTWEIEDQTVLGYKNCTMYNVSVHLDIFFFK